MEVRSKVSQKGCQIREYHVPDAPFVYDHPITGFAVKSAIDLFERNGRGDSALVVECNGFSDAERIATSGVFHTVYAINFPIASPTSPSEAVNSAKRYDLGFVSGLEYMSIEHKKEFIDRVASVISDGGVLALSFPTQLPANFIEERLDLARKLRDEPFASMFADSDKKARPATQAFESGLVRQLGEDGWKVLFAINSISERNFVEVAHTFVVLQKPRHELETVRRP